MSDVTVVIVTYNRQPLLVELLAKLSVQTVQPDVIINDDGTREHLFGHEWPLITHYLWHKRGGYHRVARYNEAVALVTTSYLIMLDDDCLPDSDDFIIDYLGGLRDRPVVRGLMRDSQMSTGALTPWFSTANVGFKTSLAQSLGPFDTVYDGNYAYEDNDLGLALERDQVPILTGTPNTTVLHRGPIRHELHTGLEINKALYKQKWNL